MDLDGILYFTLKHITDLRILKYFEIFLYM